MPNTTVSASIRKAGNIPVVGYINVTLSRATVVDDLMLLPSVQKYDLVSGNVSMTLAATDGVNVPYIFEVVESTDIPIDNTTTPPTPAYTQLVTLNTFTSIVPASIVTITLDSLSATNGIFEDNSDASFVALARRLFYNDSFWFILRQNLFNVKGVFNPLTAYIRGDLVTLDGSSFLNKSPVQVVGVLTTDVTVWFPMGARGATGTGTSGNDLVYNATNWLGELDAPSRNAVRNIVELLATKAELAGYAPLTGATLTTASLNTNPVAGNNTTSIATTAFVQSEVAGIRLAAIQVGSIIAYAGGVAPTGWCICDGRLLVRTSFLALFGVIGTQYNISSGGEDATNFRVPDLRGRVIFQPDTSAFTGAAARNTTVLSVGTSGGSPTTTLSVANMPAHNHGGATITPNEVASDDVAWNYTGVGVATQGVGRVTTAGGTSRYNSHTHGINSQGSGTAFNMNNTYLSLNYIMYTG